jgi:hypothetical protein
VNYRFTVNEDTWGEITDGTIHQDFVLKDYEKYSWGTQLAVELSYEIGNVYCEFDATEEKVAKYNFTKTESDNLTNFNIKEVELPVFGNASAEGIASMVEESLVEEDEDNLVTIIASGDSSFDGLSVEGEDYVSNLSVSDVFGARASHQKTEDGRDLITIEIALFDTEIENATQSGYAKVLNVSEIIAEQNTTLMKLMKASSGETAMLREFKNGVLTLVVEASTANVLSYTISYQSKVYVAQTSVGIGNTLKAKLKGVEFEKDHLVKYEDFQWL